MATATVRKYQDKDFEQMRHICLETSSMPKNTQKEREIIYTLYCDYYTMFAKDSCFVLADEQDKAVGYIICATNYEIYKKEFSKFIMPKAIKLSFKQWLMRKISFGIEGKFAKKYSAHMHIDILDSHQRQGYGSKLMDALTQHLRTIGVNGLFLCVGEGNEKGISFYNKYGFKMISQFYGTIAYGLDLTSL